MLNVIDISAWQSGLNLATLYANNRDLDAVIIKATGGVCIYQGGTFKPWADWCIANNKPFGFYHFLDDDLRRSSGKAEADFFVEKTREYFGKGIPIADYEAEARKLGPAYLKEFLDRVYELTGVKPVVYMSQSVANNQNMKAIADAGYKLWIAQYANYDPMYYFTSHPWQRGSVSPFPGFIMHQYTSQLHLPGWKSHLDASLFHGDRKDWDELIKMVSNPADDTPIEKPTIDDIARDVINGKYGNGQARIKAIQALGFDYDIVQNRVNELLGVKKKTVEDITKVARDVIAGKYGNGLIRIAKLRLAGYDPNKVQAEVNRILLG